MTQLDSSPATVKSFMCLGSKEGIKGPFVKSYGRNQAMVTPAGATKTR